MKLFSLLSACFCTCFLLASCTQLEEVEKEVIEINNESYLTDFINNFDDASGKLNQLAEAFSEEQYSWGPVEGVRTNSQVFVHVASGNFYLANSLSLAMMDDEPGTDNLEAPDMAENMDGEGHHDNEDEDSDHEMDAMSYMASRPESPEEAITSKADVMMDLMMSQDAVREAVENLMDMDLQEMVSAYGSEFSRHTVLMFINGHTHEHLGQAIAYARTAGVAPPWSQ